MMNELAQLSSTGSSDGGRAQGTTRDPSGVARPLVYWLLGTGTTYLVAVFAWIFVSDPAGGRGSLLEALCRFDARSYIQIAQSGYHAGALRVGLYPLFPLLTRVVSLGLLRDLSFEHVALSGLLTSAVASLITVILLDRLLQHYLCGSSRDLALALWVLNPTAVFLTVGYPEAVFMALVLAATLHVHRRGWFFAGLLIALSCLTRVFGIPAYLALLIDFTASWRQHGRPKRLAIASLGLALPLLAVLCHMAYQAVYLHDPLATIHAQQINWGQRALFPWDFPAYISRILAYPGTERGGDWLIWFNYLSLMVGIVLSAFVFSFRRLLPGLKVYTALIILSIICRSSHTSMARYLMVAFPLFIALADWGARGPAARAITLLVAAIVLDVLGTVLFVANGMFF